IDRLDHRDSRLGLDQTVEAGAIRMLRAPRRQLSDHQTRMPPRKGGGGEAEPLHRCRAVTEDDDVRALKKSFRLGVARIEQRGALAMMPRSGDVSSGRVRSPGEEPAPILLTS